MLSKIAIGWCCAVWMLPFSLRAEYFNFNSGRDSEAVMEEVRWPVLPGNEYNAIYSGSVLGANGESVGFYGGMPISDGSVPPLSIIWTFWTPSGRACGRAGDGVLDGAKYVCAVTGR